MREITRYDELATDLTLSSKELRFSLQVRFSIAVERHVLIRSKQIEG